MKKITSVLMLSMAFVLASCGGGSTGQSVSESSSPAASVSSEPAASSSVTPASSFSEPAASSSTPEESSSTPEESSSTPEESSSTPEESSPAESSAESSETDPTYIVSVKDVIVDVAVTKPSTGTDKGYFELALEAEDYVKVTFGSSSLTFAGYNGTPYDDPDTMFTADLDGDYKFYINDKDEIWVARQEDHSGEQTVHLYTKFSIPDDKVGLVAYAWVWEDGKDGAWYLATYDAAYTYAGEWDRHYTCTVSDPVGKKVTLALFNADSGVDADTAPTSWSGVAIQSGDATIADWTTSVGANLNAKP